MIIEIGLNETCIWSNNGCQLDYYIGSYMGQLWKHSIIT
jgi:hypothetical protein